MTAKHGGLPIAAALRCPEHVGGMNTGCSRRLLCCALSGLLGCVASIASAADDAAAVTPYRPSVSTPAALSAPGWVEGEFGVIRTRDGAAARRDSLPNTFKLAFTPDWGVRIGGDALVRQTEFDGSRATGFGDTAVVLKRRFEVDERSAFGIELGANTPTAKRALGSGSGKTDYSANGIYSADFAAWHCDLNVIGTRAGARTAGQGRWQGAAAASLSRALGERWSVVGEFSGTRQRGAPSTAQFLAAASYALSRRAVVDFGAARGLNRASPDWAAFAGVTVLLGKLF